MFSQMAFLILIVQNSLIYSRALIYIYRINFDRVIIYIKCPSFISPQQQNSPQSIIQQLLNA